MDIKKYLFRFCRIATLRKGIYSSIIGKKNHYSNGCIFYENSEIGNYNYFAPYVLINNAKIGNYCSIGPGCKIGLADHDLSAISTRPIISNGDIQMELFDKKKPSVLENDVCLGANVFVKQGVRISTGAVIGANAVVTKNIPEYAIAMGVPAEVKGYRFPKEMQNKIIKSGWYDLDLVKARKCVADLVREKSKVEEQKNDK